jgi:hypothetical protein
VTDGTTRSSRLQLDHEISWICTPASTEERATHARSEGRGDVMRESREEGRRSLHSTNATREGPSLVGPGDPVGGSHGAWCDEQGRNIGKWSGSDALRATAALLHTETETHVEEESNANALRATAPVLHYLETQPQATAAALHTETETQVEEEKNASNAISSKPILCTPLQRERDPPPVEVKDVWFEVSECTGLYTELSLYAAN